MSHGSRSWNGCQPTPSRIARGRIALGLVAALILPAYGLAADDPSLTWNGITLYGVFDIGVAHQTHGAPLSQDWFVGVEYLIARKSNKPITSVAPNGLSQSRVGLRGNEVITDRLNFIFNAEIGFDPQSGHLANALKALINNNGVPLERQTAAGDSSRAGQLFNGPAYAGFASQDWGTLTLGRNNTILLDNILKYDPMAGSYAFSVIGLSGTVAGMGATEDARLDGSMKYLFKTDFFRAGALYQFDNVDSSPGEAWQANLGFDYAGFSVDGVYGHKNDAIAAASLNAAQAAVAPHESLSATISDDTSYTIAASWATSSIKAFIGYEHIHFENPSRGLSAGITALGGYLLSFVNNTAFPHARVLQASWGGVRWLVTPDVDITGAIYHYDQNSFGTTRCSNASATTCSGTLNAYSAMADWRLTKRLDVYGGAMYSEVNDGLSSGYLNTSTWSPMVGFRFKF
jgi:predicted porin